MADRNVQEFIMNGQSAVSSCSNTQLISLIGHYSGGHGGAAGGVYVEETRLRAAEAQRPCAETGLRGDCPPV